MWSFWLIVSIMFLIAEIFTQGFLLFWFGLGSLIAMLVSFFVDNILIQTIIFLISSVCLTLLTRKFSDKITGGKDTSSMFNAKSVIGKRAIVIKELDNINFGIVKVDGTSWTAKTKEGKIEKGTEVIVEEIEGVKLIVRKIEEEK